MHIAGALARQKGQERVHRHLGEVGDTVDGGDGHSVGGSAVLPYHLVVGVLRGGKEGN